MVIDFVEIFLVGDEVFDYLLYLEVIFDNDEVYCYFILILCIVICMLIGYIDECVEGG